MMNWVGEIVVVLVVGVVGVEVVVEVLEVVVVVAACRRSCKRYATQSAELQKYLLVKHFVLAKYVLC